MKKLEFHMPGVNLSAISADRLLRFAESHNDENGVIAAGNPDLLHTLQMTFIRVVKHETGIRFSFLETEDGNYAVFVPDAWHAIEYSKLYEKVLPYLQELFDPARWGFEDVMTFISYEE